MGELIRREASATPDVFSGERLTGSMSGQVEMEHYHRYLLAREFCRGKDVLDVACGEGYGTALLAQVAASAVGVEIDAAVVSKARIDFYRPNLRYEQGDARAMPVPDACVDVVVSFETLEHFAEQDAFVAETSRVLRPGGVLIVSTPDRDIYSPVHAAPNPFHVRELRRDEFEVLLRRHFRHVSLSSQRVIIGSVILGTAAAEALRTYERRSEDLIEGNDHLARAPYVLALASDADLPAMPNSVYIHRSDVDTDAQVRREAELGRNAAERDLENALAQADTAAAAVLAADQASASEKARADDIARRLLAAEESEAAATALSELLTLRVADAELALSRLEAAEQRAADEARRADIAETRMAAAIQHAKAAVEQAATSRRHAAITGHKLADAQEALDAESALRREAQADAASIRQVLGETDARAAAAMVQAASGAAELAETAWRLHAIETSSVWRATRPVRLAGKRFPVAARVLRTGARVVMRARLLQMPRRLDVWRRDQQLRLAAPPAPGADTPGDTEPSPEPVIAAADRDPALAHPRESHAENIAIDPSQAERPAALPRAMHVRSSSDPDVSIVVPTYGQLDLTLACLKSIVDHPPACRLEIIVLDDAYAGPEDMGALAEVRGIRLIRNSSNAGFLRSTNLAARTASGRYIYLLNSDTELLPGALDRLLDLLDARPEAAAAGSKLLFADGRLQEAGGILWSDGSGWNYGRGQDPNRPEYNYLREVDYCSGASLLIRRHVFQSLGGFDDVFAPAYYEDADLAFRIRALGLKVLYEPRSVVIHREGASHGTDLTRGVKARQLVNQGVMVRRWADTLATDHYEPGQHPLRARDRARHRKVILVVDHYTLEPDRDAGSRSVMGMIDSLLDAGWVVKFWPLNRAYDAVYTTSMEQRGIEVLDHRRPGSLDDWMLENGREVDHILVNRPHVAVETIPHLLRNTDAVLSFYGVDLHFARIAREARLSGSADLRREAADFERLERRVWRQFDVVIYPSEDEAKTVRAMSPGTLAFGIVPFAFDPLPARVAPPADLSILFVAGFAHPPNVDAAIFLVRTLVPHLRRDMGRIKVTLAGSNPTASVRALAGPDVEVTGFVTDEVLGALYDSHRVAVVPLRFGAGVKGKVVEALSHGTPLVTTSVGSQGIDGLADVALVRDDPAEIVAALKTLLVDDAAWMKQSAAQMSFAQRAFSRMAVQRSVLSALEAGEASKRADDAVAATHISSTFNISSMVAPAAAKPLSGTVEIDECFQSLSDWEAFAARHPTVYSGGAADRIAERIMASGFREPLSGRPVSSQEIEHGTPDWREGLRARGLNSRMRAVLTLIAEATDKLPSQDVRIYAPEALSEFASRLKAHFRRFIGSEFSPERQVHHGTSRIMHQDLTSLTLPSGELDLVTTNEVLEHVSDLDAALREIARVLCPGGWHVGTVPFRFTSHHSERRTAVVDGELVHLLESQYHENPLDAQGSLVFETPGWDLIGRAIEAGFDRAHMRFVASERFGFISENTGIFVFCAQK